MSDAAPTRPLHVDSTQVSLEDGASLERGVPAHAKEAAATSSSPFSQDLSENTSSSQLGQNDPVSRQGAKHLLESWWSDGSNERSVNYSASSLRV